MTRHARLARSWTRTLLPVLAAAAFGATVAVLPAGAYRLGAERAIAAPASVAAVHQAIVAGASVTKVPPTLQPSLKDAATDGEQVQACPVTASDNGAAEFGGCIYGAPNAKRTFVLVGDSHAAMWFDGLQQAAKLGGWKMRFFVRSGCPVVQLNFYGPEGGKDCNVWRAQAIKAIRKLKPDMIVLTSASLLQLVSKNTPATSAQWETGWKATLNKLKMPQTKLVILGDIPILKQSAPECLAAHESDVQACSTPRSDALQGVLDDAEIAAAQATGASRIDTTNWLCAAICPPIVDNILVYRDQYHISRHYSLYLAGVLRAALPH